MRRALFALLLFAAPASFGQILAPTTRGIVVAHDGVLQLFEGAESRWTVEGVRQPTFITAGGDRVVVLDGLANEAVVADLASGRVTRHPTAETPAAAAIVGGQVYILARDAAVLQRIGGGEIPVAADPAFLAVADGRLYVYSRLDGTIEEIENDRVVRRVTTAPFASDLEITGTTAFLPLPRRGRIAVVDLSAMKTAGEIAAGAVPTDIAIAGGGTAITAPILAVADPSAKRVWMTEATQSAAKAFARGFLRGFLGLGLFGARSSSFPTGVDRVVRSGSTWAAYDSSSRTLYSFTKRKSSVLATGVAPGAFAATADGVVWWDGTALRRAR